MLLVEKAMAPHSSTLAWKIPWRVEPGRLQSKHVVEIKTMAYESRLPTFELLLCDKE